MPPAECADALHFAVRFEADDDCGMYVAAVDGASAGISVARCIFPGADPHSDSGSDDAGDPLPQHADDDDGEGLELDVVDDAFIDDAFGAGQA